MSGVVLDCSLSLCLLVVCGSSSWCVGFPDHTYLFCFFLHWDVDATMEIQSVSSFRSTHDSDLVYYYSKYTCNTHMLRFLLH